MSLTENGGTTMLVQPSGYGGGGFGDGFGGGWWIILLLLCGWGGMGFGGMGFGGGLGYDFPWLLNGQQGINNNVSDGFRDQMLQTSVYGIGDRITSGFGDVQNALCSGFAGVNANITNAQMNSMQQLFGVQSGIADVKYTVATENCADRAAISDGIRNVIANQTAGVQRILDKLCDQELQAERRTNDQLRQQLNMANLATSQTAQTGAIIDGVYNRLATCPVDTTPVYGRQSIFQCPVNVNGNNGCGCSGNSFFN